MGQGIRCCGWFAAALMTMALFACVSQSVAQRKEEAVIPKLPPPPPPPEFIKITPAFKLFDPVDKKTYIMRRVSDEEIVTVYEEGEFERLASLKEQEYLLSRLELDWTEKKLSDQMAYHYNLLLKERKRSGTLIDQMIETKKIAIRELEAMRDQVDVRLRALLEEGVDKEQAAALAKRLPELSDEVKYEYAQLAILEYKRWLRDVGERNESVPYAVEAVSIRDFMERKKLTAEEVIARIRKDVAPSSWLKWYASLSMKREHLIVRNTPEIIEQVENYLKR